jgi:hypothetical protein
VPHNIDPKTENNIVNITHMFAKIYDNESKAFSPKRSPSETHAFDIMSHSIYTEKKPET